VRRVTVLPDRVDPRSPDAQANSEAMLGSWPWSSSNWTRPAPGAARTTLTGIARAESCWRASGSNCCSTGTRRSWS